MEKKNVIIVKQRMPPGKAAARSAVEFIDRNLRSANCMIVWLALVMISGYATTQISR